MKPIARLLLVSVLAVGGSAACGLDNLFKKSPLGPSDSSSSSSSVRSYLGTWNSPTLTSFPTTQACGGFEWKITSQNTTQITGDFSASCSGGVTLTGNLVASITDSTTIPWAASGNAAQGSNACQFNLTGTGTFQGTSNIVLTYTGTACNGAVSLNGTETIKRS